MAKGKGEEQQAAAGEVVQVSREDLAALLARQDVLERQLAELKSGVAARPAAGLKELPPADPHAHLGPATPAAAPDPAHAVGTRTEKSRLWACSLQGHVSRVVDKSRDVAVLVKVLPVWAETRGDAEAEFKRYNGVAATIHPIEVVPMPTPAAA